MVSKQAQRIYLIGGSGSGKSTLAKKLGARLQVPVLDLDEVYFVQKYSISRPKEERIKLLAAFLRSNSAWIIEGTQTSWTHAAMARADIVVELKTPKHIATLRVARRWITRKLSRSEHKETLSGLRDLIKFIWQYDKPGTQFTEQYSALLGVAKGKRVELQSKADIDSFVNSL